MNRKIFKRHLSSVFIALLALSLQGCVGAIVGTVVDVGIEVVKIPFKVGKAVVDVVSDDDDAEKKKDANKQK